MKSKRVHLLAGVAIVLAVVAAYANSLNGPFLFDDAPAIVGNPTIRHLWPPTAALSPPSDGSGVTGRPLVNFSLAVNYAIGGLDVRGYHLANVTLHLLAALTLWGVLRRTLRRSLVDARKEARAERVAGIATLVWAVHPLLTESVTCVVQRNEVMGGLFYLLTLYCFIRAATGEPGGLQAAEKGGELKPGAPAARGKSSGGWEALAVLACFLGMATKEIVATAPLLVLLYDRIFIA